MDYRQRAAQIARLYGLNPEIFVRQIETESGFDPQAVSPAGAGGMAQIMPATARQPGFGVTPISDEARFDPEASLDFGARYMRALLDRYDGDYNRALAAYNAGPGTVDRAGGIPDITETQNYVNRIMGGNQDGPAVFSSSRGQGEGEEPRGLLATLGLQRRDPEAAGETAQPFYQRGSFQDFMGNLAIGLNELRLNPSETIPAVVTRNQERRQERATANRTVEELRRRGRDDLAGAIESGSLTPRDAMTLALQQPDQTDAMQNYEYLVSRGVDPDEAVQRAFSGGTTINMGDQGSVGWEAVDKAYADQYLQDTTSGLADAQSQAANISAVLSQLESGERLTGPDIAIQPDLLRALTNPEAQDAKDRVESVVQRSLRETLGPQFTEAEGRRLIERSYNLALTPQQNAARLRTLFTMLRSVAEQKLAMRNYFEQNGTLRGFEGGSRIPSVQEFEDAMNSVVPLPDGAGSGSGTTGTGVEYRVIE
jgi:hypothetical protein